MSTIEEIQEENLIAGQDDPIPQLFSQASSLHHKQEQDDAVTLKNPKVLATQQNTSDLLCNVRFVRIK